MNNNKAKTKAIDDIIDSLGEAPRAGKGCKTCGNEVVAALLQRYYERLDAGEDMPSVRWLHTKAIHHQHNICYGAIRNHILNCLRR